MHTRPRSAPNRPTQSLLQSAFLAATFLCAHSASAQVSLELLPGIWNNFGISINQDGSRIVGTTGVFPNYQPFIWDRSTGLRTLPLPSPAPTIFYAASPDGQSIEGGFVATSNSPAQRFRTTDLEAPREVVTRTITGYGAFQARALSNGGTYSAGDAIPTGSSSGGSRAFRWSQANGFESLGRLTPSDFDIDVGGMSHDGNVIVGTASSTATDRAFQWTPSAGMQPLLNPSDTIYTRAEDCSQDGSVIGGYSRALRGQFVHSVPLVWTNGVPAYLPLTSFYQGGGVSYVNGDGTTRVGILYGTDELGQFKTDIVIWNGTATPIPLREMLEVQGITLPQGASFGNVSAFSDNGTTIVGTYTDALGQTGTFIAIIPSPATALLLYPLALLHTRKRLRMSQSHTRPHPNHGPQYS
jgi:uncharacterized membrane protein